MNNLSFSDKFMQKTQEYTLCWTASIKRNPGYSDKFIVTLLNGTVTIDTFDVAKGWHDDSVIAWARTVPAFTQPKSKTNLKL